MKEIKLITYHNALSYGACLQAYSTVKVLEDTGNHVEVIDFENLYESRQKKMGFLKYGSAKEIIATLVKRILFQNEQCKKRAFGDFTARYLLTKEKYHDVTEMKKLTADVFVVGSDQVWNPEISGGLEPAFLLDFGSAGRKIALSSSMGSYCFNDEEKKYAKSRLDDFTAISVREEHAKQQLKSAGVEKDIRVTLDPTLLVTAQEWRGFYKEKLQSLPKRKRYILAFVIGEHKKEEVAEIFGRYSALLGLPVWRIMLNTFKTKNVDRVIAGATPEEFVALIDHADFVITDSFHGTAFSINMQTPFALLMNKNAARMEELAKNCKLESRIIKKEYYPKADECDFAQAEAYLSHKRNEDKEWIKKQLV